MKSMRSIGMLVAAVVLLASCAEKEKPYGQEPAVFLPGS
jgi:hypothetical protein